MSQPELYLDPDRFFDPDPAQRRIARQLYDSVAALPLICPHGHVDPRLFADENASLGSPADVLIIPDHYVFRMLYSQGIPLEAIGVPTVDGSPTETDGRRIWQLFADNWHLFRGTPTGVWLAQELRQVFGVTLKLTSATAQKVYDQLVAKLAGPDFHPRALFERFRIAALTTTDRATDTLAHHQAIRASGWKGDVRPTFRPDDVTKILAPGWRENINKLGELCGYEINAYPRFVEALEARRAFFHGMGAVATDHDVPVPYSEELNAAESAGIFQKALRGLATENDAARFSGHMLMELARMSIEDGLTMQIHTGCVRDHNQAVYERFGRDKGCDIPQRVEFTHNMRPLLNRFGNDPRLTLIVFTLDESAYSRELAPLAGHYPAMKLGPPWWFYDSINGMRRWFDAVMETAGLHNTVGFNDDTRAYPSIPARHDLWRRVSADWVAGLVVRGIVDLQDGQEMILDLADRLARKAYHLEDAQPL